MIQRLEQALRAIAARLSENAEVVGLILFGSYARGEQGMKSDVDLLVLFEGETPPESSFAGRAALRVVSEEEAAERLPIHLAPLLASVDRPADLGADLLHNVLADGFILFARARALARLQPEGLSPFAIVRFTLAGTAQGERVRLSRKLHGIKGRGGVLGPGAITLGRGVLLAPADQQTAVRHVLDEAGATYDFIPAWREA